ncbi:MAG: DNA translocase FtsK 4TM domain-containing protein, partial [Proteobacteria bacterium]|nr:DNA translocase FtsK 4TM domain-containing protein [Pseudomonadota bacterium]
MADAIASHKGAASGRLAAVVTRSLREGALFVFGALALVLLLALASYDHQDPSFSSTGEPGRVANLIGPVGAWVADVLLLLCGAPAFLFPAMLAVAGWTLYRPPAGEAPSRASLAFRTAGFALTLLTSSAIATLHFAAPQYPNTAGGILGQYFGAHLEHGFSFLGATLLLLGGWFAGVALFLGVSWLRVMDLLGHAILAAQAR